MMADPIYGATYLRKLSAPVSVAALPQLSETAAAYAADRAKAQADDLATARTVQYQSDVLAQKDRQFYAQLAEHQRYMADWEKQNKWATAIGVMNLAAQGAAAWDLTQKQKQQEALQLKLIAQDQKRLEMQQAHNALTAKQNEDFKRILSGGASGWRATFNPLNHPPADTYRS